MDKNPSVKTIELALSSLRISPTQVGVKMKGLRTVIYMYIQHINRPLSKEAQRRAFINAHRQLLNSSCKQGNRQLSSLLPESYHQNFTQAVQNYIEGE